MDSLYLESSSEPESSTTSPVRATKKRQKEDFADQQNMNKDLRLQTEGYQQNSHLRKKKKKKRHESTILGKDTHSSKDSSDPADPLEKEDKDDLLRKTPEKPRKKKRRHEVTHDKDSHNGKEASNETVQLDQEDDIFCEKATLKKKKKRAKQGETEDNITSKNDASGRNAEEVNVTMELENQKSKINKKRKECVRERKKTDATACSDCDEEAVVSTRTRLRKRMKSEGDGDEELVRHVQIGTKHLKKKFAKKNSKRVNEQLVEKLRQFVPNVDLKPVQDVAKMINYDLPRYIEFRRRGITLNTGRFTAKENQILRKNVEDFMALTGVDSATKLFFTDRFKEEEERITKLKRQHRFFASIANGIPRPSHRIYNRGRRIFDGRNYKGQ